MMRFTLLMIRAGIKPVVGFGMVAPQDSLGIVLRYRFRRY
jgi:hypothetical protein